MVNLEEAIQQYGYMAVLVGTFLEGETILVLAGVAAQQGNLDPKIVMVCAFCGSLVSDQLAFFIGRRWGTRWLTRKPGRAERYERARSLIDRHQTLITLIFRFLYGLRNVIPFALGMSRMKLGRYIVLNTIGAAVWAVALTLLGWAFGAAAEVFMEDIKSGQKWVLVGLAVLAVIFFFYFRRREKKKQLARKEEQDASKPPDPPP